MINTNIPQLPLAYEAIAKKQALMDRFQKVIMPQALREHLNIMQKATPKVK